MLDKSFFDFQLVEVFGQFELEELEFRFIEKLIKEGRASVPRGRYPGLLVKSSLVALSFPGVSVVFYSQPDGIQKLTSRLGEIGVGRVGLLGEMVTDSDVERLFTRVRLGQITFLAVHKSQVSNPTVVQGIQSISAKPGIGFCMLDPELFNAAETMDWHGLVPQLTTLLEVCPTARIMDLGATEDQAMAGSGFELSEAEKLAIFSPMGGGGDDDDEEFMRTVIRTSPFKDGPSGPPIPMDTPIKMPSRDDDGPPPLEPAPVVQEPEGGVITRIERATGSPIPREEGASAGPPSLLDALNADQQSGDEGGFQTISRILGRAGEIPDGARESFLEARSKISVSPPPQVGREGDDIAWPGLDDVGPAATPDERDGLSLDDFVSSPGQGLSHSAEMIPLDDLMAPSSPGSGLSSSGDVASLESLLPASSPGTGLSASTDPVPLDELIGGGDNESLVDLGPADDDDVEVLLDDDEDELLVLVDDDEDDYSGDFGGPNLESLLDGLDHDDEQSGLDEATAPDDLAKALSSTFPTRGPAEAEALPERDESMGAVSRIVLPDELPEGDLASRAGTVTSIILPSDAPSADLDEVMDDDLDDLLGPDLDGDEEPPDTDMLLADLTPLDDEEELVVATEDLVEAPAEGGEEDLVGLLDSIVSETVREPEGSPSSAIILPDDVPEGAAEAMGSPLEGLDLDALVQPSDGPHPGTVSGILLPDEEDTAVTDFAEAVDEDTDVPDELSDADIEFALQALAEEQLSETGELDLNAAVASSEDGAEPIAEEPEPTSEEEVDFDDYESPEAIEFALRALAEDEMAESGEEPVDLGFDAIEQSLDSAIRLPKVEPELVVEPAGGDFDDFDSPNAIEAALAAMAAEEAEEEAQPVIDELEVAPVAEPVEPAAEEVVGGQFLPDTHLELDPMADLDDDDSPEAIEAALKALAEEELSELNPPVAAPAPAPAPEPASEPEAFALEDGLLSPEDALADFVGLDDVAPSEEAVIGNESLPDTHFETEAEALDDLDSPEAIEAALRRLAAEELAEEAPEDSAQAETVEAPPVFEEAQPVAEEVELDPLDQMLAATDVSEEQIFGDESLPDTHLEGEDDALDDLDSPEAIEAALRRLAEEELREEGGTAEEPPLPEPTPVVEAEPVAPEVSADSVLLDEVISDQPQPEAEEYDAFADFDGLEGLEDALAVLPDEEGQPVPVVTPEPEAAVEEEAPPGLDDFFGDEDAPDDAWVHEAMGGAAEAPIDAFEPEPVVENTENLPGLHLELDDDALDDLDSPEAIEEALRRLAEEELSELNPPAPAPEPEPAPAPVVEAEPISSSDSMLLDQVIETPEAPPEDTLDPLDQMLASQASEEEVFGDESLPDTHLEMEEDALDDMDSPEAIEAALRRLAEEELREEGGPEPAPEPEPELEPVVEEAPTFEPEEEAPLIDPAAAFAAEMTDEAFDAPDDAWVQEALGGEMQEDAFAVDEEVFGEEVLPDTHLELEEDALDDMDSPEAIEAALRRLAEEELREEGAPEEEAPIAVEAAETSLEDELLAALPVEEERASDSEPTSSEPMTDVGAFLADLQMDEASESPEDNLVQGLSDELLVPVEAHEEEPLTLSDIIGEDITPEAEAPDGLLDDVISQPQPETEEALSTDSLLLDALISEGTDGPSPTDSLAEFDALAELDALASVDEGPIPLDEPVETAPEPLPFDEPQLGDLVSGPEDVTAQEREEEAGAVSRVILPGEESDALAELDAFAELDALVEPVEPAPEVDPLAELDAMAELEALAEPDEPTGDATALAVEEAIAALGDTGQPAEEPLVEPIPFDEPQLGDLVSGPSDETAQHREDEMGAVSRVILPGEEGSGLAELDALIDTLETPDSQEPAPVTDGASAVEALAELDGLGMEEPAPTPEPMPFDEPQLGDLVSGPSDEDAFEREEEAGAISRVVLPGEEPSGLDFLDEMLGDVDPLTAESAGLEVGPGEGLETSPGEAIVPDQAPVSTEMQAALDATLDETLSALASDESEELGSDTLVDSPLQEALGGLDDTMVLPVASPDTIVEEPSAIPEPFEVTPEEGHDIPREALAELESSLATDFEPIEEPPAIASEPYTGVEDLEPFEEPGAFEDALAEAEAALAGEDLTELSDGLVIRDELGQEEAPPADVEGSFVAAEDALAGLQPVAGAPVAVPMPMPMEEPVAAPAAPAFVPPPRPVALPDNFDLSPALHRILRQTDGDFSRMYQTIEMTVNDPEENAANIENELKSLEEQFAGDRRVIFALGTIEMLRRRTAGGVAHYLRATELCRREADGDNEAYVYGRLHEHNPEDVGVAERYAESLLALDQNLQATFILSSSADKLVESGNVQDAIPLLEKVIELEANDDGALRKLLSAYRSSGRESQALEYINSRLAAEPKRIELQLQKGISLVRLGRIDRSEESFKQVLDLVWDDPFKLAEMEERFDEYSVVVYRERCRSRILELDPDNTSIRGKIAREERLKALEADAPLIEDLLPIDEPDELSDANVFDDGLDDLEMLGAEEEDEEDVFSRTIAVSPKFSRIIDSLRGLEEELQVAEAGDRVADRFLAELIRKFLEVGERVGVEHPSEALELYERSRSYLPYFKDPMALFLWTEQLDRRIDNTRCRIN